MTFDLPQAHSSIIKVIGVGGGGGNAVNHMYRQGIKGVEFIVCNTDQQHLDASPVPKRITLGASLTKGRGAGAFPEVGRNAAIENIEEIKSILANDTQMVFITAGMGGGTGTGAAPVIAQAAKELGILTVGIITMPFSWEGNKRRTQAEAGAEEMRKYVDTLLVIGNEKLREIYGNLRVSESYAQADDVLTTAAKGIADIITSPLKINTDFADITTVMKDSGHAIMGTGIASGEGRAAKAVEEAMRSPLLNNSNITGARYVLLNIMCSEEFEITMDELCEITDFIQDCAGQSAEIIKGYGLDPSLGDTVKVTLIATGFNSKFEAPQVLDKNAGKTIHQLVEKPGLSIQSSSPSSTNSTVVAASPAKDLRQVTIEFEVVNKMDTDMHLAPNEFEVSSDLSINEPTLISNASPVVETPIEQPIDEEAKRRMERAQKLKGFNFSLKNGINLTELENEPAYIRKNIDVDNNPMHSTESQVSRFSLTENADKSVEIKTNNSFLHDQAD